MKNLIKLFSLNIFVIMLLASCGQGSSLALQEGEKEVNGGYGFTNQEREEGLEGENGAEIYTCKCGHEWDDHKEKGNGKKGACCDCSCSNYRLDESKLPNCEDCGHKYSDHRNGKKCDRCSCKQWDDGVDFEKY